MRTSLSSRPQLEEEYSKHLRKIQQIKQYRQSQKEGEQIERFASHKILKTRDQSTIYKQNMELIKFPSNKGKSQKKITIRLPMTNYSRDKLENIKPTKFINKIEKKTLSFKQFLVEHDKVKLEQAIRSQHVNKRQFKKRIKSEVSQYVKLRQHMQKYKTNNMNVLFSKKNDPKTERKIQRKSPDEFKKFLTQAIEQTRKKVPLGNSILEDNIIYESG